MYFYIELIFLHFIVIILFKKSHQRMSCNKVLPLAFIQGVKLIRPDQDLWEFYYLFEYLP